jgi:ABC-type transport system involved in multi-copper enzyme maturation permease subunit
MVLALFVLAFGLNWYTLLWLATDGLVADLPYLPPGFTPLTYWAHDLYSKVAYNGYNYPGWGTVLLVMLLGVIQMAGERSGRRLEHLLTLPVRRREIVVTKFVAGAGTITLGMAFGLAATGLLVATLPTPAGLTVGLVARDYLQWWSILLAVYALAFLAGTLAGNWRAAILCCTALEAAPICLAIAAVTVLTTMGTDLGSPVLSQIIRCGEHLTPVLLVPHSFRWEVVTLLPLAALAILAASVRLFEVSPFEQNGEFFALGNSYLLLGAALGAVAAVVANWGIYMAVLGQRPNPPLSLFVLAGVFAAVLQGARLLERKAVDPF